MLKKFFVKLGRIILANLTFIIGLAIIFFVFTYKFPYFIESPGGLLNLSDRISVNHTYTISGSYNMSYVTTRQATIPTLILSYFNKDWDIYNKEEYVENGTTIEEDELRGKIYLRESNDNALIAAYTRAGMEIDVKSEAVYVVYLDEEANTDLKVGDKIVSVDGVLVNSVNQLAVLSNIYDVGDKVNVLVESNGKSYDRYAYVYKRDDLKVFGIYVVLNRELEYTPQITFNFEKSEYGSSGGLMQALFIYDALISKDVCNGLKVAGTGSLDADGNVLTISGVKYKLKGAVKDKADIFFVPSGENYEEALNIATEADYDIDIVEVKAFDDALRYLYNYENKFEI